MAEMKLIKIAAQKRRAKMLAEHRRTGWTITKLALKHGLTRSRVSKMLVLAREEE